MAQCASVKKQHSQENMADKKKKWLTRQVKRNKVHNTFLRNYKQWIDKRYDTCVTVNVNAIYAATDSDVIHAKGAPNL